MDLRNALKGGMLENCNGVIFDFFFGGGGGTYEDGVVECSNCKMTEQ